MPKGKEEEQKAEPMFSGKAAELLLGYRFDTPLDKLLEMSILSSRQALSIAVIKTMNDEKQFAFDIAKYHTGKGKKPKMFFLADKFVNYFLQAQRSTQEGRTLKDASDLSLAAVEASTEIEEVFKEPIEGA